MHPDVILKSFKDTKIGTKNWMRLNQFWMMDWQIDLELNPLNQQLKGRE